ncbi:MAG: dihydropteroate synthase [Wenzhouxiangella sp.]
MRTHLGQSIQRARSEGRPLLMGVVNVTPDSFSDGGLFLDPALALAHALALVGQGADMLDIGGESTRPGAEPVGETEELARVIPVIEALRARTDTPISIDTSKPAVMRAAVAAGANMINDVCALQTPGAAEAAAQLNVPVCLMHMQGQPRTMQQAPVYADVVEELLAFFRARIEACLAAGLRREQLVVDPGFGFGKTLEHNLVLLAALGRFSELDLPVLAGLSRKSMLGAITGRERPEQRVAASLAAALLAGERGAAIIRVHDVAETRDALMVWQAVRDAEQGGP